MVQSDHNVDGALIELEVCTAKSAHSSCPRTNPQDAREAADRAATLVRHAYEEAFTATKEIAKARDSWPKYRICVRSSRRAAPLSELWEKLYLTLFGPEVCLYVTAAEMPTYKRHFPGPELREGGEGPGGQVTKMLQDTPSGTWLVVLDDNIRNIKYLGKPADKATVDDMLRQGMTAPGVIAFSASQLRNTWGKELPKGLTIRQDLLYGAFFAMKVPEGKTGAEWASMVASRHGSISDDLERSCRIYREGGEGCVGIFKEVTEEKKHPPGLWQAGKGGISSLYTTPRGYMAAKVRHLKAIAKEFPEVQRLALDEADHKKFQAGWKFIPRLRGR